MSLSMTQATSAKRPGWWEWTVSLSGSEQELDQVDSVQYTLHPTFPQPVREVSDRVSRFALSSAGWGEFMIYATANLKDGSEVPLRHWLCLVEPDSNSEARPLLLICAKQDEIVADTIHERLELAGHAVERIADDEILRRCRACVAVFSGSEGGWLAQELELSRRANKPVLMILMGTVEPPECLAWCRVADPSNLRPTIDWLNAILDRRPATVRGNNPPTTSSAYWNRRFAVAANDIRRASESVFPAMVDGKRRTIAVALAPDLVVILDEGQLPESLILRTPGGDVKAVSAGRGKGVTPYRTEEPLLAHLPLGDSSSVDHALALISPGDGTTTLRPAWISEISGSALMHDVPDLQEAQALISLASGALVGIQSNRGGSAIPSEEIRRVVEASGRKLPAPPGAAEASQPRDFFERRAVAEDYSDRTGYDPAFLGVSVPLPTTDREVRLLPYTHFTVALQPKRRLALYTAVNINGRRLKEIHRDSDHWLLDPRVPADMQLGGEFYKGTPLDRGHMVRRLDPVWGAEAERAERDTFHYSNSCPQHRDLNRKIWNDLEDYIYDRTGDEDLKVSVFTGPVMRKGDPAFHGAQLPVEFWKLVVMRRPAGQPLATAYLLSQEDMIQGLEFQFGQFRTYQVSVASIERRTGLAFGDLSKFDPMEKGLESLSAIEVRGPNDIDLAATDEQETTDAKLSPWSDWIRGKNQLSEALDTFDWSTVRDLIGQLVRQLAVDPSEVGAKEAALTLQLLRRKRRFREMVKISEAFLAAGIMTDRVRRHYAQALIDLGLYYSAEGVLRAMLADTSTRQQEREEAQGLLGRVFKQIYVDANAPANPRNAAHLRTAIESYWLTYSLDPEKHLWHGINIVACLRRAERDGISVGLSAEAKTLAANIVDELKRRQEESTGIEVWDIATQVEACLALGDYKAAEELAERYALDPRADAFEIGSTLRQLREVWQLRETEPPGDVLLPLLNNALLKRRGGSLRLEASSAKFQLQKILGDDRTVTLRWYRTGLERARSIARIEVNGKGIGTGWLVSSAKFFPNGNDRILLITNAHVVAPETPNRYPGAAKPSKIEVNFQMQQHRTKAGKIIFHSPVDEFDATFLELESPPPDSPTLPLDLNKIEVEEPVQRLYIIGHPGGREIEFSIHDNYLLGIQGRLIHYRTPSEEGSSGSPVFGPLNWEVIALHHAGNREMARLSGEGVYEANEGIVLGTLCKETERSGRAGG